MINTLFLQSEVQDPYKLYEQMLYDCPVFWDGTNKLWAIYSYKNCKEILSDPTIQIPSINCSNTDGLNEYTLAITGKLARISNGPQHEIAKQTALGLFGNMKAVSLPEILSMLLTENDHSEIDWVAKVCKRLPLLLILKSFAFNEGDCEFITGKIEQLVKILLPEKTQMQISEINTISNDIYPITEKQILLSNLYKPVINALSEKYKLKADELVSFCISNLIGLLIQCYDAGRGILSNSLLQTLKQDGLLERVVTKKNYLKESIIETLRFDPPVHNTRRIATDDVPIGKHEIKKGQLLLVVLAAANRDPQKFNNPKIFNIERKNNNEHLTFGIGSHKCLAENFSVNMTTETLAYLFEKYKAIKLAESNIQYEPMINVRLPKNLFISLK
jgi:cytochrome P450